MNYTLAIKLVTDGQAAPTPKDLYDALEAALAAAAQDPKPFLDTLQAEEPQGAVTGDALKWALVCINSGKPVDDISQLMTSAEAARIAIPDGMVWCREDLMGSAPLLGEIYSDDRIIDRMADIRPYLIAAQSGEIEELEADDWQFCEAADRIAYALEQEGDPSALALFHYLGLNPTMSFTNDTVGFAVRADREEALSWIRMNRTDLELDLDLDDTFSPD